MTSTGKSLGFAYIATRKCGQKASSEHDIGYAAGWRNCADEATRIVASHIDRLEPGRQQCTRDALLALLASMRSTLVVQRAVFAAPQPPSAQGGKDE